MNQSLEYLGLSHLRGEGIQQRPFLIRVYSKVYSKMHLAGKGINTRKQPSILIQSREALILSVFLRKNINSRFQILQSFVSTSILKLLYFDLFYRNDVTINLQSRSRLLCAYDLSLSITLECLVFWGWVFIRTPQDCFRYLRHSLYHYCNAINESIYSVFVMVLVGGLSIKQKTFVKQLFSVLSGCYIGCPGSIWKRCNVAKS